MLPEEWFVDLVGRDKLAAVCRSHGENMKDMMEELRYDRYQQTDYVLCAVLLRLADILDFDVSRAPHVLHEFQKISTSGDMTAAVEWGKHQESKGFRLLSESTGEKASEGALKEKRILAHRSVCKTMQGEHAIGEFLDYVDKELENCRAALRTYGQEKWKTLQIPEKVEREFERRGYQTGEYCLTLEADNVLDLLVGDNVYSSDSTFIRELLQNALDAVRARRAVDRRFDWKKEGRIVLSDWIDAEGYQRFRIDDCGIGMTEETIRNFFLRAGRSYYKSDAFRKLQYENRSQYDFSPISQFGIGILSCFLTGDRIEVSTRHYDGGRGIRFSMKGTWGYYSLAVEEKSDRGTPMPCAGSEVEGSVPTGNFRQRPGTSIAVRLKEPLSENTEKLIRSYLCFPDIPVRYRKGTETIDFPTEQELMAFVKKKQLSIIPLSDTFMQRLDAQIPGIVWKERPCIGMISLPLDKFSESPLISGCYVLVVFCGSGNLQMDVRAGKTSISQECKKFIHVTGHCIRIRIECRPFSLFKDSNGKTSNSMSEFMHLYREQNELTRWCAERFDRREPLNDILKEISGKKEKKKVVKIYEDLQSLALMAERKGGCVEEDIPFSAQNRLEEAMERFILPRCDTGEEYADDDMVEKGYNGIFTEITRRRTNGFDDYDSQFEYVALLLSGAFQPRLDLSREKIRSFPMKAAGYIELLGNRIGHNGFSCEYSGCYDNLSYGQFAELLDDAAFCELVENVGRNTKTGSLKVLRERLALSQGKVKLIWWESRPEVGSFARQGTYFPFYFLRIFRKALVQKEFELRWDMDDIGEHMDLFATGLRQSPVSEAEKLFLPLTFVCSCRGNTEILTEANGWGEHILNADHPFSVWMITNAEYLSKRQRALWKKVQENLCKLEQEKMIRQVNEFLQEIQRREGISIPDNVWLKEKDFLTSPW